MKKRVTLPLVLPVFLRSRSNISARWRMFIRGYIPPYPKAIDSNPGTGNVRVHLAGNAAISRLSIAPTPNALTVLLIVRTPTMSTSNKLVLRLRVSLGLGYLNYLTNYPPTTPDLKLMYIRVRSANKFWRRMFMRKSTVPFAGFPDS